MSPKEKQEIAERIAQANALRRVSGPDTRLDLDANGELTIKPCKLSKFRDEYSYGREPKTSKNMTREGRLSLQRSGRKHGNRMARDQDYGT